MQKLVVPDGLVERHEAMRSWFLDAMAVRRNERTIVDHALTAEGASWLVAYILHYKPRRVVELGSGFSTLALGYACASSGSRFTTADHDAGWATDVKAVTSMVADVDFAAGLPPFRVDKWTTLATLRSRAGIRGTVDLVLVDHGPEMMTRLNDLPWIAGLLRRNGIMALDDCRTRHSYDKKAAAVLRPLGLSFGLVQESYGRERWLGVARRRP